MRTRGHSMSITGFSLVEVLIVLALLAILAVIAYPSLRGVVLKSRRSDAQAALMLLQQAQERWRAANPRYATLAEIGQPVASPLGHYRLAVEAAGSAGYVLTAQAVGAQSADRACRILRLSRSGSDTVQTSGPDPLVPNPADINRQCWNL